MDQHYECAFLSDLCIYSDRQTDSVLHVLVFNNILSRVHVHNLRPFASRSYTNKSCPYVPRFDLKSNTRYIVLWSNSLCLNVLGDSDPLSLRVMCVRDISIAGCGL